MCNSGLCPHEGYSGECNLSEEERITYHKEIENKEPKQMKSFDDDERRIKDLIVVDYGRLSSYHNNTMIIEAQQIADGEMAPTLYFVVYENDKLKSRIRGSFVSIIEYWEEE
jgi:hypothetical protein